MKLNEPDWKSDLFHGSDCGRVSEDKEIIRKYDDRGDATVGNIERFAFYDEAKTAYCIISTSEKALYANVMLQKGVVINK